MTNDVIKTLIAEAYGEGPEGMRRVAETIINRAAIRGLTPEQVVRQPHQYTGLHSPGDSVRNLWGNGAAVRAAQEAWDLALKPGDPTGGADHYHTNRVNPGWNRNMPRTGQYGDHIFYASRPIPPGELPQVATQTDTRRPVPPSTPTPLPPMLAAQRNLQPLKPNVASLYEGFYPAPAAPAPRGAVSNENLVFGRGISDSVERSAANQENRHQTLASALEAQVVASQRPPVPPMPVGTSQSYAAQDRAPRVANVPLPRSRPVTPTDIARAPGVTIASIPTSPVAPLRSLPPIPPPSNGRSANANVTLGRSEQAFAAVPNRIPAPVLTTAQIRTDNGQGIPTPRGATPAQVAAVPYNQGQRVASIPTASSPLRTVIAEPAPANPPRGPNTGFMKPPEERLIAGIYPADPEVAAGIRPALLNDVGTMPSWADFQTQFGAPRLPPIPPTLPTPLSMRPPSVGMMANVPLPRVRPVMPAVPRTMAPAPVARTVPRQPVRPPLSVVVYSNRLPAPPPVAPQPVNNRYIVNGQAVQKGMSNALAGTSASGFGGDRYDPYSVSTSISG